MKFTGSIWDWQRIQDYELRREALRVWLAEQGRENHIFDLRDDVMEEVRERLARAKE